MKVVPSWIKRFK
jgi:hypothetical protein